MSNKSFQFTYTVRLDDLDYMGIVGNAAWLILLERSRADLLTAIAYPMTRFFRERIGGVVAELKVAYLRPAKMDDVINITITAKDPTGSSGLLEYVATSPNGQTFIKAETRMVFVDSSGKPIQIPDQIRQALFTES